MSSKMQRKNAFGKILLFYFLVCKEQAVDYVVRILLLPGNVVCRNLYFIDSTSVMGMVGWTDSQSMQTKRKCFGSIW